MEYLIKELVRLNPDDNDNKTAQEIIDILKKGDK